MEGILSILVLVTVVTSSPLDRTFDPDSNICIGLHCPMELSYCILNKACYETITCMGECPPFDAQCSFACGMENVLGNRIFQEFLECAVRSKCMPEFPEDGKCLATDDQALQEITDIEQVQGDWWVVKGQNCGQDDIWRGGYDWYPCQHGRFVKVDDGWINNTTYCNGENSKCDSEIIHTFQQISVTSPGVVTHDYPKGQAPIVPQVENWKFISHPNPDWALVAWCGHNPVLKYDGAFVVSRQRSISNIPSTVATEFRFAAEKLGIDYDKMCVTDNTNCPE